MHDADAIPHLSSIATERSLRTAFAMMTQTFNVCQTCSGPPQAVDFNSSSMRFNGCVLLSPNFNT